MHTLHGVLQDASRSVGGAFAIRNAVKVLGAPTPVPIEVVRSMFGYARDNGHVMIGSHADPEVVLEAARLLERGGIFVALVDASEEELAGSADGAVEKAKSEPVKVHIKAKQESDDEDDESAHVAYSPAAYETAMALLGYSEGNAANACVQAFHLGRTTQDRALYGEVILALVGTFPGIATTVRQLGIMPDV